MSGTINKFLKEEWIKTSGQVQSHFGTPQLQNSSIPALVTFRWEKNVSALCACSGLSALARTCRRHNDTWHEKMRHHLVLLGFSSQHEFQSKLMTSTRALPSRKTFVEYLELAYSLFIISPSFCYYEIVSSEVKIKIYSLSMSFS